MKHELARTLTVALVSYLNENRPEGTMDCSSGECVSLEKAFTEENFDSAEAFINDKLSSGLTEFEKAFLERVFHQKPEDLDEENKEIFCEDARFVLALAREQLIKDGYVIVKKAFYDAVKEVPPEVMKEVSDNVDKREEELSEFELSLLQIIEVSLSDEVPNGSGGTMSWAVALSDDDIKKLAPKVLAIAKKELARRDEVITLDNLPPYDKGFQDGKAEAITDLERTFECNPEKLPLWLQGKLGKKHLEGYIMGREETMREMKDFLKSHFNCEKAGEGTYYKDYERNPEPIDEVKPSLPSNLDEAAREIVIKMHPCLADCTIIGDRLTRGELMALVKAGAEWMAGQGETREHFVIGHTEASHGHPVIVHYPESFEIGDEVIVQIRKKEK